MKSKTDLTLNVLPPEVMSSLQESFCETAKSFPQFVEMIINFVLDDSERFINLIVNDWELFEFLELYPDQGKRLMDKVLSSDKEFNHIFTDNLSLAAMGSFPQYIDKIMSIVIKDKEIFKRLFDTNISVHCFVKKHPQYKTGLFQIIFSSETEFERLYKAHEMIFFSLSEEFPEYAEIFNAPSIEEAIVIAKLYAEKVASEVEIRKNARVLAQAARTKTGPIFFHSLDPELQILVAGCTGNVTMHREKEANKIASINLCRPGAAG